MTIRSRKAHWLALTAGLALVGAGILNAGAGSPVAKTDPPETRVVETYGKLPLTFEANQGQTDPKVKFLARGNGYKLFLSSSEAVLAVGKPEAASRELRLSWLGANPDPRIFGKEERGGRRNFPAYARVAYESVYPGIDLVFYGDQRQLEHDYVLAAGADPRTIRFAFEGADRLEVAPSGELVIRFGKDEVRLHRPIAYQDSKAGRVAVPVEYRLAASDGPGLPEVGFTLGIYDPGAELVID